MGCQARFGEFALLESGCGVGPVAWQPPPNVQRTCTARLTDRSASCAVRLVDVRRGYGCLEIESGVVGVESKGEGRGSARS